MDQIRILVIEDDDIVARTIERCLRSEFRVQLASSGAEGLRSARCETPDLVILDVIMPGMDGYAVCREIRADPVLSEIPILFLTAKTKDEDKITGFTVGADDYLGKPFNVDELILRIRAILRRSQKAVMTRAQAGANNAKSSPAQDEHKIVVGQYVLDTHSYELTGVKNGKIRLTPVQYDLLHHLMSHPGEIFSPARLLDEVWDYPSDAGSPDLVRVHIKNLRERVEEDPHSPKFIVTIPGYGYTVKTEET